MSGEADGYLGLELLNYKLIRKLGEGGFGAVYLAEHIELGRRAAVKILHPEYARHREVVDRFFREAKAVCAIGHPVIVDVTNFGRLPSGEPFYMMDFVEGQSLAEIIRDRRMPFDALPAIFDPVMGALAAAHAKRIVHRDLKPDNIMVREEDGAIAEVKLLDFGIAKLMDSEQTQVSRTGSAMGTPSYMAPEQGRDAKNVDARADIYGFAATVFAAVTGRPPFIGSSATEIMIAAQTQPAPLLRTLVPTAPAALEAAIARCLGKDPASRPANIRDAWAEMRIAIGAGPLPAGGSAHFRQVTTPPTGVPALGTEPTLHTMAPSPTAPSTGATPHTTLGSATGETAQKPPKRRGPWIVALGAVAAAAVVVVVVMARGGDKSKDEVATVAPKSDPTTEPRTDPALPVADPVPVAKADPVPVAKADPVPVAKADPVPDPKVNPNAFPDPKPVVTPDKPIKPVDQDATKRAAEARRKEQEKRKLEEEQRKKAEEIRIADERRIAEERRLAEEREVRRLAEEARKKAELAKQVVEAPKERTECSKASFERIYGSCSGGAGAAKAAMRRLKQCKDEKQAPPDHADVQAALVRCL